MNLKKDPCFKFCINSEPGEGGGGKTPNLVPRAFPSKALGTRLGDSAYEMGGVARRKFWIKPLKETDPGVAQAFFDP